MKGRGNFAAPIALSALVLFVPIAQAAVPLVSCARLRLMMLMKTPRLTVIDVRPAVDFAKAHIQGAQNIPATDIQAANPPQDGLIVVYCTESSCPLSANAAQALMDKGYQNVSVLDGGFAQWRELAYPVDRSLAAARIPTISQISADAAAKLLASGQAIAVDVRPAAEFAAGHLPGARNIPLESLAQPPTGLPQGKTILIYDRLSTRSKQATKALSAAGLNVVEFAGGVAGWARSGRSLGVK